MHISRHQESLNYIENRRSLHQRKINFAFRCTSCNIQKNVLLAADIAKKSSHSMYAKWKRNCTDLLSWFSLSSFRFFSGRLVPFKTAFYVAVFGVIVLCCFGSLAGYNSSSSSLRDRFVFFRVYFIEAFSVSFTLKASSWARNEMEMEADNSKATCFKGIRRCLIAF